ncbi:MAG TPA: peptide-binding protein [Gemmatimonadota bacterium]|jgi:peptide/nickel transport system substrate-binding protein
MSARTRFVIGILVAVATACGGGEPAGEGPGTAEAPVDGGTAVISTVSDFDAFNELISTDYDTNQTMSYILFSNLVQLDEDMNYQPYLADSFWMSDDGLTLTFRIRDGMKWHDGVPVTADDVVWTYEMSVNDEIAYANLSYFQYVTRAVRVDDRTVRFEFSAPHSDALMDFTEWSPMPKHLLQDVPPAEMRNAPFNRHPVGNGPFRFVSWDANQQAVFEANPDFVLGRPHLDRIVVRVIPEQTTELTELLTGGIDLMRAVPPAEMHRVEESDDVYGIVYQARSYTFIAWNTRNPLFASSKVRRALTMGINRQQIVDALLYGYGTIAVSDAMPFQWEFNDRLQPWPYDVDQARQMLAEEGWTDHDGDGIIDKDGRPFRFVLGTNQGNDLREDIVVIVQNDLKQLGIDVQPRLIEWNTLITDLKAKRFEAAVSGWSTDFKFNPTDLFSTEAIEGKYNYPSYSNPEADSLMTKALVTLNREDAKPLWIRYSEIIHEDQPYTFLYYLQERLGVSNRLRDVEADARGHLISAAQWWIPENMQNRGGEQPVAIAVDADR